MSDQFKDLIVWQKSVAFVTEIYRLTEQFPTTEIYGLTSQMRRAAVSIPTNIAEGQARRSLNDAHVFLGHSRGSLSEVQTQLVIAGNLSHLDPKKLDSLLESTYEISRLLDGLLLAIDNLRNKPEPTNVFHHFTRDGIY